jgi:hypothetical protein
MKKALLFVLLAACVEEKGPITGTQSIYVEMVSPVSPGTVMNRLPDSQRTVIVNLTAKDSEGQTDATFNASIRVYAQFLGTLTPELQDMPLATLTMTNGVATNQTIMLPPTVFGATTLWFDNGAGFGDEYVFGAVTGTSPALWYRDPFIADLQRPANETSLDALSITPLTDKQVRVGASEHGTMGALVVTSTFAQGYTVADVRCATGGAMPAPPCTSSDYAHAMVFTFSSPRDQFGRPIVEGEVIESFNGGLTEFNGLTEIGFPRSFIPVPNPMTDPTPQPFVNRALMPAPVPFQMNWLDALDSSPACMTTGTCTGRINFERNEAGPIELTNVTVCPIDDAPDGVYARFKQWSVDPNPDKSVPANLCRMATSDQRSRLINLITAGTDFTTDPHTLVGRTLPKVVGIVRPVNLGSFNVWIVYPRGKDDITQ